MKKLLIAVIGIVVLAGAAYALSDYDQSTEYVTHYKIIVEVETPEGLRTGSSVRKLKTIVHEGYGRTTPYETDLIGEAVVIDMGEGKKPLFGLIDSTSYAELLYAHKFKPSGAGGISAEGLEFYKSLSVGKKENLIEEQHWPVFVTFKDINDPTSIYIVYKNHRNASNNTFINNFEEIYSSGYSIKAISVEITDESIEWGKIDQFMPKNFKEVVIDGWRDIDKETQKRIAYLTGFEWRGKRNN